MNRVTHLRLSPNSNRGMRQKLIFLTCVTSLTAFSISLSLADKAGMAFAQGFGMGSMGGMGAGAGRGIGAGSGGLGAGGSGYAGSAQANIDTTMLHGNGEMLREDLDYEDYLLQKRSAFAQQLQQNEMSEDKLRAYAEQRLKALTQSKTGSKPILTAAQQGEAHDLIDWLKKDAEQRANNKAWLQRQDQALAYLEQDQMVSYKNQKNALHNLMEDNIAIMSEQRWRQNMALSQLHLQQNQAGAVSWGRPPQDGLANARGAGFDGNGIGGFGGGGFGGGGGNYGRRWGY